MNNKFVSKNETVNIPDDYELLLYSDIYSVKDESLSKIYITDLLDGYSDMKIMEQVLVLARKLKKDGELHIQGLDFSRFCSYVHMRAVPWTQKIELFRNRINCQSLHSIPLFIPPELTITNKRYVNGYYYYLCAIKNQ